MNPNLVNFHNCTAESSGRKKLVRAFAKEAAKLKTAKNTKAHYRHLRNRVLHTRCPLQSPCKAARFTLGLKVSFQGRLNERSTLAPCVVERLQPDRFAKQVLDYQGIGNACTLKDAFRCIREALPDDLLFLDPPYLLEEEREKQYSAGDFGIEEHRKLRKELQGRHFVLCHRDCPQIRELYKDCVIQLLPRIMQINRGDASGRELVIMK